MNNKLKVSIVVPIYNKEQILHKCLDSLVNQTMQDIEIILINDGSTDNSEAVCLDYVEKYPNLVHYHAFENGGVSKARNRGIDLATGEYIGFVDSDDWVALDFCEKMFLSTNNLQIDLICCGIEVIDGLKREKILPSSSIVDFGEYLCINPIIRHSVSNKLFKLNMIRDNQIKFIENIHLCEDLAFVFIFLSNSMTIKCIEFAMYVYQKNVDSVTQENMINTYKLNELFSVVDNVYNYLTEHNLYAQNKNHFNNIMVKYILIRFAAYIVRNYQLTTCNNKKDIVNVFFDFLKKYLNKDNNYLIYFKLNSQFILFASFPRLIDFLKGWR